MSPPGELLLEPATGKNHLQPQGPHDQRSPDHSDRGPSTGASLSPLGATGLVPRAPKGNPLTKRLPVRRPKSIQPHHRLESSHRPGRCMLIRLVRPRQRLQFQLLLPLCVGLQGCEQECRLLVASQRQLVAAHRLLAQRRRWDVHVIWQTRSRQADHSDLDTRRVSTWQQPDHC